MMGSLILVSVPIGNIDDITKRALDSLRNGRIFLAEDTRVLRKLFDLLSISTSEKRLIPFHDHSDNKKYEEIFEMISSEDVCLVSDAGSPIISDPAYPLIRYLLSRGIKIETCPGVTSIITALELSGLPPHPFHFHGFLPRERGGRLKFLESICTVQGTHVVFEGVSRAKGAIEAIATRYPEATIVVARELTKLHESVYRFVGKNFNEVINTIPEKGEFVILFHIDSASPISKNGDELQACAKEILEHGIGTKSVAKLLSMILDVSAKEIYNKLSN